MPASQLRCEAYISPEGDMTGEKAIECGAIALPCADCGDSAGCEEHAILCPKCGKAICEGCANEHGCVAKDKERAA
jgi:hypothetical protein